MTAAVLAGIAYWIVLSLSLGLLWVLLAEVVALHHRRIAAVRRDTLARFTAATGLRHGELQARARYTAEALAAARNDIDACLGALPQDMYDRIFAAIVEDVR